MDERHLQIDHRIPYAVAGDEIEPDVEEFMLIDASSQRAKSWSCENCQNLKSERNTAICRTCFWAFPENYKHIATVQKRRLDIVWSGEEVAEYDAAGKKCSENNIGLQEYIKRLLRSAQR